MRTKHIAHDDLPRWPGKVTDDGGDLRFVEGVDHGLPLSVMHSQVAPGSGPRRHRHPHAEVFVLHDGESELEIDGERVVARAGDVVIIPPNAWHVFRNTGGVTLRQTAVHAAERVVTEWEDGSRRP